MGYLIGAMIISGLFLFGWPLVDEIRYRHQYRKMWKRVDEIWSKDRLGR